MSIIKTKRNCVHWLSSRTQRVKTIRVFIATTLPPGVFPQSHTITLMVNGEEENVM